MLDVGAAAGWIAARMLEASPQSRVVAFEPFPGNHRFIDQKLGSDPRARIVKKAVSNNNTPAKFYVATTVENGTGDWAGMEGYSSAGLIVSAKDQRAENAITVPMCRLDDEINEPVRFLKMDVQGGEFRVLDGAQRLFDHHGVELVLTEFMGDRRIIDFLAQRGYAILDTGYHSTRGPFDPEKWRTIGSEQLSTGQEMPIVKPFSAPESPDAYTAWFAAERQRYISLWTDLIAIAPWSDLLEPRWSLRRFFSLASKRRDH
jgi:FkbM family methyltransferase